MKIIPTRVYIKYGLLMIPGTAVLTLILVVAQEWIAIPVWLFCGIIGFAILKDIVMFPFVWRSYDTNHPGLSRSMIGARGIAIEPLAPTGFIDVQGELWKAERIGPGQLIEKGEMVRVKSMKGLKLFVEPMDFEEADQ
jgi:membrane-bound ClpP family serine protease